MSIDESLAEFELVIRDARAALGKKAEFRAYISTSFGCPFEGKVAPRKPLKVLERLAALGIPQISIGDTIGVATPDGVSAVMAPALRMRWSLPD
jgi:hydroxymethylglutaryl-CoA lyase